MKLTLIKEEIQDKNIVDEVMETHLYEDEKDKEAKAAAEDGAEVVNDEVVDDEQPESDAVQDILDPEETTGFDIPDEPLPLEDEPENTESEINIDTDFPIQSSSDPQPPVEPTTGDESEVVNVLNGLISSFWTTIDQLKYVKNNNRMVNDERNADAFNRIIESLIDDTTINVGMIYKLLQLASPEISMLIDKGKNKAEETILNR